MVKTGRLTYAILIAFFSLMVAVVAEAQPWKDTSDVKEHAYLQRISASTLHGVYIPKDLTDAFAQLNELMVPETRQRFKGMSEEELPKMNTTLGNWIRVNWGFYEGSRITAYLNRYNVSWPEDMSELIIITYHRYLNNKPLDMKALVDHYSEKKFNYWQKRAVEPAGQNR